jgi:NTE family protein
MHVVRLIAPAVDGEDHTKDIDFTAGGIAARWRAGYTHTKAMLDREPWGAPVDPIEGIVIHDPVDRPTTPIARGVDGFAGRTQ